MITGKSSSSTNKPTPPPPLPPKPKATLVNVNNSNVPERGFRRYFSSKTDMYSPYNAAKNTNEDLSAKFDSHYQSMQLDNNVDRCSDYFSTPEQPSISLNASKYSRQLAPSVKQSSEYFQQRQQHGLSSTVLSMTPNQDHSIIDHAITPNPIVTESPEEANNNIILNQNPNTRRTSTVEILEVPSGRKFDKTFSNYDNSTFSKSSQQQQQLFYGNNSYAAPVVTTATDDEDGNQSDTEVALPTEMEVESILNESSNQHPPRTSTPNQASQTPSSATILTATIDGNTHMTQVSVSARAAGGSSSYHRVSDEDVLNMSRETDEGTTSVLNQSGGELIGIYDNSDSANNSKDSPRAKIEIEEGRKLPYPGLIFDDSVINQTPTSSGLGSQQRENFYEQLHAPCQNRIKELESLTNSLLDQVDKLKNEVENLTSKVDGLETNADDLNMSVKKINDSIRRTNLSKSATKPSTTYSPGSSIPNYGFSQSTSTINKLTPSNGQHNVGLNPMSTYSRSNVAIISRNSNPSQAYSTGKFPSSQSCNNTVTKSMRKTNIHASTNSLYAESFKSGSTSISPTPNYQHYRQSTSPTSLMSMPNRRDQMAHTSMLSLSSLGHSAASTLKKGSAASGSVSNLSQVGSQLSNWPSITDFIPAKHRAKDIIYSEEERLVRMVLYNRLITMRLPNWVESNYNLDKVVEPPSVRLKLDWVYGYRGRDCRSNIFYLPTGECVYFVASIVVLYSPDEKKQRHYLGHTDSVKCLAVHPNKLIIASGQSAVQNKRDKRPIVRVWNSVNLNTLKVIGFNEDFDRSISCLAFSKHDQGATLAVVDESPEHTITLLDWQREQNWRIAETNSGHEPVLAIDFHPIDKYSLVAIGKSSINFWDIRGMTLAKKAGLFDKYDKPKYVLCLTFNDLGDTVTGDSNGNVIIWPRGSNRPKKVIHDVHQGGVFSILAMKDGSYLTGGRDRRVIEWDEHFNRTGREAELPEHCGGVRYITYARGSQVLIGTLRNSILLGSFETNFVLIMQGHSEATSSLAVHPKQSQYLTGGFDDQIHLFDTRTHEVIWSKCLMMPATSAGFSPNGSLLVIGSTLGKWLVLDAVSQEILFTKCEGSGTINCIKFSPDGEYFSMGSGDAQVYIYQTTDAGNKFCRIGTCVGHSAPIKEIDWSDDNRYIQTQSMNLEILFWKATNCRPLDDPEVIDDLKWFTHNCTLGFSVIGIWSDSIDSALINYCDRSNNKDLIVSVTDTGSINIFKWPPCYDQCLSQKYYGNVEKFNFIKFLHDDSRLIAVGAKNCVTTEWIVDKGENMDL